jgi:hypothetical protein
VCARTEELLAQARERAEKNKVLLEKKFGSLKAGQLRDYKSLKAEALNQRYSMSSPSPPNINNVTNNSNSVTESKSQ